MNDINKMRDALQKIAELAKLASNSELTNTHDQPRTDDSGPVKFGCAIKQLPKRLLKRAAETAVKVYPVNAPANGPTLELAVEVEDPLALTVRTSKYWGPTPRQFTVSFMQQTPPDLRKKIVSHMNAWSTSACISFIETNGTGHVRISLGSGGYWSYLGTDILEIPNNRPTMNLEGFSLNTPDSEFVRVVRHETGHTLGFPHEHMRLDLVKRIDPQKAYEYFRRTQGWNKRTVDQQVLTPLNEESIMGTPADQDSIMCYQLPGLITFDGQPIRGGNDINATDYAFAAQIYPKATKNVSLEHFTFDGVDDWDASEDVAFGQIQEMLRQTVPHNSGVGNGVNADF